MSFLENCSANIRLGAAGLFSSCRRLKNGGPLPHPRAFAPLARAGADERAARPPHHRWLVGRSSPKIRSSTSFPSFLLSSVHRLCLRFFVNSQHYSKRAARNLSQCGGREKSSALAIKCRTFYFICIRWIRLSSRSRSESLKSLISYVYFENGIVTSISTSER